MRAFVLSTGVLMMSALILGCNESVKEVKDQPETVKNDSMVVDLPDSTSVSNATDTGTFFYLTFDDGPYHTTTKLTDFLNKNSIKSSFFIVGSQVKYSSEYEKLFNNLKTNTLFRFYNHTYTHAVTKGRVNIYYSNLENVWEDIVKNKQLGFSKNNITRLPGTNAWRFRSSEKGFNDNSKKMLAYLDSMKSDERIFGWDFEWTTKQSRDTSFVNKLYAKIEKRLSKNKNPSKNYVILFHDFLFREDSSLEYLSAFLNKLKTEHHVQFKWAEEYPDIN